MLILPERCSGAAGSHMTLDALPVKAPDAAHRYFRSRFILSLLPRTPVLGLLPSPLCYKCSLFVALQASSLLRGLFLQDGGDVGQVVEDLECATDVLRRCAVDHKVEDVEAAGFRFQVSAQ